MFELSCSSLSHGLFSLFRALRFREGVVTKSGSSGMWMRSRRFMPCYRSKQSPGLPRVLDMWLWVRNRYPIGVLFGGVARKIDGVRSLVFTWWFNHLQGYPSISNLKGHLFRYPKCPGGLILTHAYVWPRLTIFWLTAFSAFGLHTSRITLLFPKRPLVFQSRFKVWPR